MVAKTMKDVSEIVGNYSGNMRKVLEYSMVMKSLVDQAKSPGFSEDSWAPLADYVATDEFERVGNFLEVMSWQDYIGFLTRWATGAEWECSFKRISESDGVVFLELEERSKVGAHQSTVNSNTVYEFNEAGKLKHLDIYLQMQMPDPEMMTAYE